MKYKKNHPYTILSYIYKFAFLFIFPLLQQIIINLSNPKEVLSILWKNIFIATLIFIWSYINYRTTKYCTLDKCILIKRGIFIKHHMALLNKSITYITVKRKIFESLFNCFTLTLGSFFNIKSTTLNLSKKNFKQNLYQKAKCQKCQTIYQAKLSRVFLMSIFWANPVTNSLVTIPFIQKTGKILGQELSEKLYSAFDIRLSLISIGLSPIIASLIYLLLVAFLIAFTIQFFRYSSLLVKSSADYIIISHGFFSKTEKIIEKANIPAVSIEQTSLMKTLNLYNVYVHILNLSKKDENKKLLLAATKSAELISYLKELIPTKAHSQNNLIVPKEVVKKYLFTPVSIFFILTICAYRFKGASWYNQIISLIINLAMLLLVWWIYFRIQAFKHCGIALYDCHIKVCGYKKLTLYTAFVPIDKIQSIEITQSPLQSVSNIVSIKIHVSSGQKKFFLCKHLKYDLVKNFVENVKNFYML